LATGFQLLTAATGHCGNWLLASGYWLVPTGLLATFQGLLAIGYWLLATGYWLLAIGYWLRTTGYWPLAACNWLAPANLEGEAHTVMYDSKKVLVAVKGGPRWSAIFSVTSCIISHTVVNDKFHSVKIHMYS
jgi:hypothetical protein